MWNVSQKDQHYRLDGNEKNLNEAISWTENRLPTSFSQNPPTWMVSTRFEQTSIGWTHLLTQEICSQWARKQLRQTDSDASVDCLWHAQNQPTKLHAIDC